MVFVMTMFFIAVHASVIDSGDSHVNYAKFCNLGTVFPQNTSLPASTDTDIREWSSLTTCEQDNLCRARKLAAAQLADPTNKILLSTPFTDFGKQPRNIVRTGLLISTITMLVATFSYFAWDATRFYQRMTHSRSFNQNDAITRIKRAIMLGIDRKQFYIKQLRNVTIFLGGALGMLIMYVMDSGNAGKHVVEDHNRAMTIVFSITACIACHGLWEAWCTMVAYSLSLAKNDANATKSKITELSGEIDAIHFATSLMIKMFQLMLGYAIWTLSDIFSGGERDILIAASLCIFIALGLAPFGWLHSNSWTTPRGQRNKPNADEPIANQEEKNEAKRPGVPEMDLSQFEDIYQGWFDPKELYTSPLSRYITGFLHGLALLLISSFALVMDSDMPCAFFYVADYNDKNALVALILLTSQVVVGATALFMIGITRVFVTKNYVMKN